MDARKIAKQVAEMVYNGGSVTRNGCYTLPKQVFIDACEELFCGGDGTLAEFDRLTWLSWDEDISEEDCLLFEASLRKETFWSIHYLYGFEEIRDIERCVARNRRYLAIEASAKARRVWACQYTSKRSVREAIFTRDGPNCKLCGTIVDLTLDHIIPVSKGGEDCLENLQVLCQSCNSKKGAK